MAWEGNIEKMETSGNTPVQYVLPLNEQRVPMNELLGKNIRLLWGGRINCVVCGKLIKKAYGQGFCFEDFSNAPENADCIMRPELCLGHLGIGRDAAWEYHHHVQEHFVYLALSSAVKVGVTRSTQIPTRWIDQGAWKAIILAKVPYRKLAGEIETELKKHLTDKTNWQQMLKNELATGTDLWEEKQKIEALLPEHLRGYITDDREITEIQYPVNSYPSKINSLSFEKSPVIEGILTGIKGQYIMIEGAGVMNIRSQTGYYIQIDTSW